MSVHLQRSILIVDDSVLDRRLISHVLKSSQVRLLEADSGQAALELIERVVPDLLLLDLQMPDIDGLTLLARLSRQPRLCEIPVIVLTVDTTDEKKLAALAAGARDFITKPFHAEELKLRVKTQLRIRSMQQEITNTAIDLRFDKELQEEQSVRLVEQLTDLDRAKTESDAFRAKLETEHTELLLARTELQRKNADLQQALKDLKHAQAELLQADKLAAVGQLAAGIAHEINTPIQFVGDNVRACSEMFDDLQRLFREYECLLSQLEHEHQRTDTVSQIRRTEEQIDVAYIFEDIPQAFAQSLEGLERVRTIVKAMKDFSYTGQSEEKLLFDVNAGLQNTLTVARNELKYVANLKTDFGDVPSIEGYPGELNQVFLNLLINAAHAIKQKDAQEIGAISVSTRVEGNWVVISIADSGCGISAENRYKIFEPFFTTKEIGQGTGQGLAISRNIVVDHHQGRIEFESEVGSGTTFHVSLPRGTHSEDGCRDHATCSIC